MNKSIIGKKLLSLLLSVLMCLSLIPTVAFATVAEGETGSEATKGSSSNPYTLEEFGAMTREDYIAAQNSLGGTMYVNVGEYSYDTNGVLGNGVRVDSAAGVDKTDLNYYAANGYKGEGNDGANGKTVVFTGTSISNNVTGYTNIDKIGTSLLLAVPAYTTVKFEGIKFNGVFSFDYQLYTSPWSQLQKIEFNNCKFNGLIVGAIAATELAFDSCTFNEFTNAASANNSNPTWIRPAYGNWTKGDNEGQGEDFKSLTKITFTNNTVKSTRPVKFERISQWDITSTVTVDGNYFDITNNDKKNVGMYLGFNAAANLVMGNNQKSENTAALYTVVYNNDSVLPDGSTVKDMDGNDVVITDAVKWKTTDKITIKTPTGNFVAKIGDTYYETLQAAIDAAGKSQTVTLVSDTRENVTIAKPLTLDLNGYTLNGGTVKGKPALTITAKGVTVKDSSTAQTGTIMREDTAENSGISSHYVIDVQGGAWVFFEGGNVKNNSGNSEGKGASLVRIGDDGVDKYPGLNIKGGTFTQDNFIAIKVDRGDLFLNGGTINSANSYAIENWLRATVKGGTVNGTVSSWVYSTGAAFSNLEISGGKVNGNVASVNYDDAADKQARIFITGGEITGTLGIYTYNNGLNPITDNTKATIEVTGGTFTNDPTAYLVESSSITVENGKYSVAKAYLAEVDGKQYYTMDEAFKAQTDSGGKDIVLLRDYEKAGTFSSGSIKRTVDLNGHTWTYTGTDVNSAAFEINHPNATLTIKNGKVISNTLVGLIPSAMGGTITYDNSTLIFENVEMISNGHSGIETNGNNTNDTVTLKNSTLNVPNGFGIYFASSGTLNIENSAITAKTMGVQVCSGSLNISGDSVINVTGDPVEKTENDGAIQDGAAVSVVNRPGYKGLGKVTITGGTFKSAKGEALKAYTWENKTESKFGKSNVISVSGGTFSSIVPEDYCEEGFISSKNADGTYTVKAGAYVAEVGGVKYETVNEAITAANNGDTVTLLADTTEDVLINKSITLDLGGKTLTNIGVGKATISITGNNVTVKNGNVIGGASYYNIEVKTGASATLEGVTATAGNTGSSMVDNWGTLTINSGTYTGGLDTVKSEEGSKLTITGGKFTLNYAKKWAYNAVILVYGDTTISGGEFIQNAKTSSAYPQVVMTGVVEGYDAITRITGGTFTNNFSGTRSEIFWALGKATSDNFEVSGGTFNKSISEGYCADGFIPTNNADGTYGVKEGSYVAQIGTKKYETLADAIRLATNGKTITLLKDITVIGSTTTVPAGKTITIDLNGFTLNGTNTSINAQALLVKGNLTLTDSVGTGKICSSYTGTSGRVISVEENGTLIINGVTVTTEGMAKSGNAIHVGGNAKLVLNSGTVKADCKRGNYAIRIMSTTAAFEMNGGEIIAEGSDSETYITALGGNPNSSIAITGGKITAPKANAILARSSNITITGGEFSGIIEVKNGSISGGKYDRKVTTKYCAAGLYSEIGTDGLYEIVASEKLETGVTVKKKLTLGNDLTMTYRVISDGFDASYIVFSFENYSLKKYEDTTVSPTKNADGSFSFVFKGINPQRMNDILKATVYLEKDGKLYEYAVSDYSVKAYCLSILNNPAYGGRYNEIISNLLKYGEEAQKYTGYRSDDIVTKYFENTAYSPISHTDKIDSVPTYNETKSVDGGITITTKKLLLDNAVKLRVYFTLDDNVSINQVKFAAKVINNGETIRTASFNYKNFVKDSENNRYYFEFSGIMATELDNMLVFTSTVNNVENDSLTYNVNNYLANHASDSDIGALIQALFNYGYTCDNF